MTEIQYIPDPEVEIVEEKPSWELLVSEFIEGRRFELHGHLRQARASANVCRHYGKSSMEAFAGDVGKSPSWCYALAKVWFIYGHIFESGSELSTRLETLDISKLIKATSAKDPIALAERAHDEDMTSREVEEAAKDGDESQNIETVEKGTCPHCNRDFLLREAEVRTEAIQ